MLSALRFGHQQLDQLIQDFPQGNFIDGTLGNGHDLIRILTHSAFGGHAYGFDIQEQAIQNSQERIKQAGPIKGSYQLFQASHDQIDHYLNEVEAFHGAIYNLGYLPGGDHQVTTLADSTIQSLKQVAEKLVPKGKIIVIVYHGHPQGKLERDAVLEELSSWPQENYQVLQYGFINQINNPPFALIIEKR